MTATISRDDLKDLVRRGRRSRRRSQVIQKIVTVLLVSAGSALLGGWELMLAVGVIHAEWIRQLPTVGYWWAVLVVYLLRGIFSIPSYSKDKAREGEPNAS
jgi:hypothetical protein